MPQKTQTLESLAQSVRTAEEFEHFLHLLVESYRYDEEAWEHRDVEPFLESLRGFFGDRAGFYRWNRPDEDPDEPSWRAFAEMLLAARIYE